MSATDLQPWQVPDTELWLARACDARPMPVIASGASWKNDSGEVLTAVAVPERDGHLTVRPERLYETRREAAEAE